MKSSQQALHSNFYQGLYPLEPSLETQEPHGPFYFITSVNHIYKKKGSGHNVLDKAN